MGKNETIQTPMRQEDAIDPATLLPLERECCGTFPSTPHRATCDKYRGKFKRTCKPTKNVATF